MSMFAGLSALCCFASSPYPEPPQHANTHWVSVRERSPWLNGDSTLTFLNGTTLAVLDLSYLNVREKRQVDLENCALFKHKCCLASPQWTVSNVIHNDIQIKLSKVSWSLWILKMSSVFWTSLMNHVFFFFFHVSFQIQCWQPQKGHMQVVLSLFFPINCGDVSVFIFCQGRHRTRWQN